MITWAFMKLCSLSSESGHKILDWTRDFLQQKNVTEILLSHHENPENVYQFSILFLSTLVFLVTFHVAFSPLDRVLDMTEVGWGHLQLKSNSWFSKPWKENPKKSKQLAAEINRLQKLRKTGNLPPVYPNGWFAVAETRAVAKGQVVFGQALGQNIAVFRNTKGEAMILDAYCPHLGANMAVGGVVKGDCLECPFHGWQFDGKNGQCTTIPYANKVPDVAKVRHWPSKETNGFIFMWHDAEDRPPSWEVPDLDDVMSGRWRYRGRTQHEVLAHVQEIPENGADLAHLNHLHAPAVYKGADLNDIFESNKILDVATHEWRGNWEAQESPNEHVAVVKIKHSFDLKIFKLFKMSVEGWQIGPGLVHLHMNTPLGKAVLIQTVTPKGPLRQRIVHQMYSASTFIAPLAKIALNSEACHVERDIMIWNSKQYMQNPVLVTEDKLIKRFRKWYSQFYSEKSPRIEQVEKNNCDW